MPALIIILKLISFLAMAWRAYVWLKLKKLDSTASYSFELFSRLEVAAGFAVALIGWLAVLNEKTYVFTACLNALAIVLTLTHNMRIVVGGDRKIVLGMKIYDLKEIKGMKTGRFSLYVFTKTMDRITILVPLTDNDTVRKMKYLKK